MEDQQTKERGEAAVQETLLPPYLRKCCREYNLMGYDHQSSLQKELDRAEIDMGRELTPVEQFDLVFTPYQERMTLPPILEEMCDRFGMITKSHRESLHGVLRRVQKQHPEPLSDMQMMALVFGPYALNQEVISDLGNAMCDMIDGSCQN